MTDKAQTTVTDFHGDAGEAAEAIATAAHEYRTRTGQDPTSLIIGVDLYERLVVNRSTVSYWTKRALGYSSSPSMAYPDTFMGIPLSVVPDEGMVRAIGSPFDMLMMHGGRRRQGNQRPGLAATLASMDHRILGALTLVTGRPFADVQREMLIAQCSALGLAPEQAEVESQKHGTTLEELVHALARGWTPDSEVSPRDYEVNYPSDAPFWAVVEQLSLPDGNLSRTMAIHKLTKKYVPLLAAAQTDEERDAISKQWTAERRALTKVTP